MTLRLSRSINKLSSLFKTEGRAIKRRLQIPAQSLIYVLLSPGDPSTTGSFSNAVTTLVTKLSAITGIGSVAKLQNIRPPSGLAIPRSNLDPKTAANALLITVNTALLLHTVGNVRDILQAPDVTEPLLWTMITYTHIQAFQPTVSRSIPGTCIVTVSILPAPGNEDDVDAWYREENLKLLSASSPDLFLRSNRYTRSTSNQGGRNMAVEYVAVHEFTSVKALFQHSLHHGPIVEDTEWSKRVLEGENKVQRTVWEVQ